MYRRPSPLRNALLSYWPVLALLAGFAGIAVYLFLCRRHTPFVQVALMVVGFHVLLFAAIGLFRLGRRHARARRSVPR